MASRRADGRIEIDGSRGEGGGQILRSGLALSLITGRPVRFVRIRAKRSPSGLSAQHLEAVNAAAAVGGATVAGAALRSQTLTFTPGEPAAGPFRFRIPTAGSAPLVLHTVYLPLALRGEPTEVEITGGTHLEFAPSGDFLTRCWAPMLTRIGLRLEVAVPEVGFYPRGGGRLRATIHPVVGPISTPAAWAAPADPADVSGLRIVSFVAGLPLSIAQRQADQAAKRLGEIPGLPAPAEVTVESRPTAGGPGTMLGIAADRPAAEAFTFSLGALGKRAETVADEACDRLAALLRSGALVEEHLADQLLLPLAVLRHAGRLPETAGFRTAAVTRHLLTHAEVIEAFLGWRPKVAGELGQPGEVSFPSDAIPG